MLETLLVGIMLFVSTNVDDIFLTMAFFADPRLDARAVVAGKYAGIAVLVAASWSSEIVFLNDGEPGCGAPVKNDLSERCWSRTSSAETLAGLTT